MQSKEKKLLEQALLAAKKHSYEDLRQAGQVSLLGTFLHLQAVYEVCELRDPADPQLAILAALLRRLSRITADIESVTLPTDFKVRDDKLDEAQQHVLATFDPDVAKLNRLFYK